MTPSKTPTSSGGEKCKFMILTPHYDNGHNGGMWCAEEYPCEKHGEWKTKTPQKARGEEIPEHCPGCPDCGKGRCQIKHQPNALVYYHCNSYKLPPQKAMEGEDVLKRDFGYRFVSFNPEVGRKEEREKVVEEARRAIERRVYAHDEDERSGAVDWADVLDVLDKLDK